MTFHAATALVELAPGRYAVDVPDGWQQGRGAFGGLVLGTLLRAIESVAAADNERSGSAGPRSTEPPGEVRRVIGRRTRTLLGDLVGPVLPGPAEVRVDILRRGAHQTNLRADFIQGGDTLACASAVVSGPRPVGLAGLTPRAEPPPFDGAPAIALDRAGVPVFTQQFEYRLTGPAPWTGDPRAEVAGWIRPRAAVAAVDAPLLIALLDAFWPAYFSTTRAPRPIATVSFAAQIACDPAALDPAAPFFYRARAVNDHDGFELELRELFDARGHVLAMNQQTFAILK